MWGGEEKKSASEAQEAIAMALINNQFLHENQNSPGGVAENARAQKIWRNALCES